MNNVGVFITGRFIESVPFSSKNGLTKYRNLIACNGRAYSVSSTSQLNFGFGDDISLPVSCNVFDDKLYFTLCE